AKFVIDFVQEVTGINKRLVADALHSVTDIGFVSFTTDENAPCVDLPGDIVADLFLRTKIEETLARIVLNVGFPRAVEAFQAGQQPGHAAFHEAELGIGKLVKNSVEDYAGKGDHLAERMAESMNRRVRGHIIEP